MASGIVSFGNHGEGFNVERATALIAALPEEVTRNLKAVFNAGADRLVDTLHHALPIDEMDPHPGALRASAHKAPGVNAAGRLKSWSMPATPRVGSPPRTSSTATRPRAGRISPPSRRSIRRCARKSTGCAARRRRRCVRRSSRPPRAVERRLGHEGPERTARRRGRGGDDRSGAGRSAGRAGRADLRHRAAEPAARHGQALRDPGAGVAVCRSWRSASTARSSISWPSIWEPDRSAGRGEARAIASAVLDPHGPEHRRAACIHRRPGACPVSSIRTAMLLAVDHLTDPADQSAHSIVPAVRGRSRQPNLKGKPMVAPIYPTTLSFGEVIIGIGDGASPEVFAEPCGFLVQVVRS